MCRNEFACFVHVFFCAFSMVLPQVFRLFRFQKMSQKTPGGPSSPQVRNIKCLVLDEADRLLDMGFEPQMRSIHKKLLEAAKVQLCRVSSRGWGCDVRSSVLNGGFHGNTSMHAGLELDQSSNPRTKWRIFQTRLITGGFCANKIHKGVGLEA